jgi:hypothetical protein
VCCVCVCCFWPAKGFSSASHNDGHGWHNPLCWLCRASRLVLRSQLRRNWYCIYPDVSHVTFSPSFWRDGYSAGRKLICWSRFHCIAGCHKSQLGFDPYAMKYWPISLMIIQALENRIVLAWTHQTTAAARSVYGSTRRRAQSKKGLYDCAAGRHHDTAATTTLSQNTRALKHIASKRRSRPPN